MSPSIKSSLAETTIKSIKNHLYKAMHELHTTRWIDLINDVIASYNSRPHRNLFGFTPASAKLPENYSTLRKFQIEEMKQYQSQFKKKAPSFKPGEKVKIAKDKSVFSRGFTEKYHPHTYTIDKVTTSAPYQYSLVETPMPSRRWYEFELSRVQKSITPEYYIAKSEENPLIELRSGKIAHKSKNYLLKDHSDANFQKWLTQDELDKFQEDHVIKNKDG